MIRLNYWGVVMLYKVLSSALLATLLSTSLAGAQSLASIGGPVNLPPAGFTGQQFVDNRGCVFLRAGFGATVNWVPRVSRDHRPLCGFPPSFGAAAVAAADAHMAPDPETQVVTAAPADRAAAVVAAPATAVVAAPATVAAPTVVATAPVAPAPIIAPIAPRRGNFLAMLFGTQTRTAPPVQPAPVATAAAAPAAPTYVAADMAGPASGQVRCFADAPRLQRVLLRSGGTALVCTPANGGLTGWRSPVFPNGSGVGAALSDQMLNGATVMGSARATTTVAAASRNAIPTPPPGYKLAWKDDRLNPLRGVGTAQGQAQQDRVWTRDVPAVLVADQPKPRATTRTSAVTRAPTVTVSTMSAPASQPVAPAGRAGASYVQVGTFGQPANAEGVKTRLAAMGFPVSTSKITRSGKVLQIVYAGPFASRADAESALSAARGAGFGDAILR